MISADSLEIIEGSVLPILKARSRIVIIGNSGSGKTYLAKRLGQIGSISVIHLDQLFWAPGGFSEKRSASVVHSEIDELKKGDRWIVEGVFGELAERFLDSADYLIWLDLSWDVCREGLLGRGSQSSQQNDPVQAEVSFQNLLIWAEAYWTRTNKRSHFGHQEIFDGFSGAKVRITNRESVKTLCSLL